MPSLNDHVIVIVVNALGPNKKPTNFFDKSATIKTAALNSIYASMGNQHSSTNIQKQAYPSNVVTTIRSAYGITGTNFNTHSPYVNGKRLSVDSAVKNGVEVVLVKNDLDPQEAFLAASRHQLIPMKKNDNRPSDLGEVLPLLDRPYNIKYESTTINPGPSENYGPGGAGNPGGFSDFGGQKASEQ